MGGEGTSLRVSLSLQRSPHWRVRQWWLWCITLQRSALRCSNLAAGLEVAAGPLPPCTLILGLSAGRPSFLLRLLQGEPRSRTRGRSFPRPFSSTDPPQLPSAGGGASRCLLVVLDCFIRVYDATSEGAAAARPLCRYFQGFPSNAVLGLGEASPFPAVFSEVSLTLHIFFSFLSF